MKPTWFLNFTEYKATVDEFICKLTHGMLNSDALPDYDYWKAFQNRIDPKTTAKRAIKAAKEF